MSTGVSRVKRSRKHYRLTLKEEFEILRGLADEK